MSKYLSAIQGKNDILDRMNSTHRGEEARNSNIMPCKNFMSMLSQL